MRFGQARPTSSRDAPIPIVGRECVLAQTGHSEQPDPQVAHGQDHTFFVCFCIRAHPQAGTYSLSPGLSRLPTSVARSVAADAA
jgi:hypothetical protein